MNGLHNIFNYLSVCFFLAGTSLYSQSFSISEFKRGYISGFKSGYCYGESEWGCHPPVSPFIPNPELSDYNSTVKSEYTLGYDKGFKFGSQLKDNNSNKQNLDQKISFNQYVPQSPVEAMAIVGMIKQQKYDHAYNWIQNKIYQLSDLKDKLFSKNKFPKGVDIEKHKKYLTNLIVKKAGSVGNSDLSDNNVFIYFANEFNSLDQQFYAYYEKVAKQTESSNVSVDPFLYKNRGEYDCEITEFKQFEGKWNQVSKKDGGFRIVGNRIYFPTKTSTRIRNLKFVGKNNNGDYLYESSHGAVSIDSSFNHIYFSNLNDPSKSWTYKIKD